MIKERTAAGICNPYFASRSKIRNLGAESKGKASRNLLDDPRGWWWCRRGFWGCDTYTASAKRKPRTAKRGSSPFLSQYSSWSGFLSRSSFPLIFSPTPSDCSESWKHATRRKADGVTTL